MLNRLRAWSAALACGGFIAACAALIAPVPANAYVYWVNGGCCTQTPSTGTIGRATNSGTDVDQSFVSPPNNSTNLQGLAVGAPGIFWVDAQYGTVGHANLDGSSPNNSFITDSRTTGGVAFDSQHVFWSNHDHWRISRANIDGTSPTYDFIDLNAYPAELMVAGSYLYWGHYGVPRIGRANVDGTGANDSFIVAPTPPGGVAPQPYDIATDGTYLYWTDYANGTIGRANLDGTGAVDDFITGASHPLGIAYSEGWLYWANYDTNTIGEAKANGSSVDQSFITGAANPYGVEATDQPEVQSQPATNVDSDSARLQGTVNPMNWATTYHFDLGTAAYSYNQQIPSSDVSVGSDGSDHAVSQPVSGLSPNTTYHYRVVATSAAGVSTSPDFTFTTAAAPAEPAPSGGGGAAPAAPLGPPVLSNLTADTRCVSQATLTDPHQGKGGLSFSFNLSRTSTVRYEIVRRVDSPHWKHCPQPVGTIPVTFAPVWSGSDQEDGGSRDTVLATTSRAHHARGRHVRARRVRIGRRHHGHVRLRTGDRRLKLVASAGQKLQWGSYLLRVTATADGQTSRTQVVQFWVLRKK